MSWTQTAAVVLLASATLACGATQAAEPVKIATLNAGWLWNKPAHDRWIAACKRVGWDERNAAPGPQREELDNLPYCNVHNGLKWPPEKQCPKLTPQEILTRPLLDDKNCRETKDLVEWSAYEEKLAALRSMMVGMADVGITLIAFQEVFDTASLDQILPPGWKAATSADDKSAPRIPQHVGVAWKTAAHKLQTGPLLMSISEGFERPLRPGFTFTTHIAGRPTEFLVLHLKSGCRSSRTLIKDPVTDNEKAACPALEKQVFALETWVDARRGQDFVILGDFNRELTFETKMAPNTGTRPNPRVAQLFSELNDDDPKGSKLWIAAPARTPSATERERPNVCKNGHGSIDHILVSDTLNKRVRLGALEYLPITLAGGAPYKSGMKPHVAAPTDHCPHFVQLTPN